MARIKHQMTAKEYGEAGKGRVAPKPGVYRAKLVEFVDAKPAEKNPRWELTYEITQGQHAGFRLFDYITHGSTSKFKKDQLWVALDLVKLVNGKPKLVDFDPDKLSKYPEVNLRVKNEDWQGEMQARPAGVFPADEDPDEDDADEDEDGDEDAEESEDEAEADDDDDDDETAADEDDEVDFDDMSVSELKVWAEENEVEIPAKTKGAPAIRSFLAAQAIGAEDEDDDDETDDDDEGEEIDLAPMKLKELRALADEYEVDHSGLNSAQLREALAEALGGDEDEDEDEDDEPVDYSEWNLKDLKEELESRGLKTIGPKTGLVKRLIKSDETGGV